MDFLYWGLALLFVIILIVGVAWGLRTFQNQSLSGNGFFNRNDVLQRLEVLETRPIDAKLRLVLIRHDDKEHLLLTGGPVDLVIESGITPQTEDMDGEEPSDEKPAAAV